MWRDDSGTIFISPASGNVYHPSTIVPPNVWVGVSASTQEEYDSRVSQLCDPETGWPGNTFVSIEPCLGSINLYPWSTGEAQPRREPFGPHAERLIYPNEPGWIIAGSANTLAHGAAAFTPEIARSLRDQAAEAGVPYWLKQMEGWRCGDCPERRKAGLCEVAGRECTCGEYACWGLAARGRSSVVEAPFLTGRQHLECPPAIAAILRREGKTP